MKIIKFGHEISVVETVVNIAVSKRLDMSNFDKAICWLLKESGKSSFESIGLMLGLGTMNYTLPNGESKIYKDISEIDLLKILLSEVELYHLISVDKNKEYLDLTSQGAYGLETNNKYQYFRTRYSYYNILDISIPNNAAQFLYHKIGLIPQLKEGKPEKMLPDYLTKTLEDNPITLQIKSTLSQNYPDIELGEIINTNQGKVEKKINLSVEVDIGLGQVLFWYDENVALNELNDAISESYNEPIKEYLIQKARYLGYIGSKDVFSISLLTEFSEYDFFNFNYLIQNELVNWDEGLIEFAVSFSKATSLTWELITRLCPEYLILKTIHLVSGLVDWSIFTSKCISKPSLILSNYSMNWDLEYVLNEFDLDNIEVYVELLYGHLGNEIEHRLSSEQWWLLTSIVSDSFLEKYIYSLPLDFRFISRKREYFTQNLIKETTAWKNDKWDRELDWSFISKNYDLDFIATNFHYLQDYIDPEPLMLKLGQFPSRLSKFLKSDATAQLREKLTSLGYKVELSSSIILNAELLDTLDSLDYLQWGNHLFKGVEHNSNLIWDSSLLFKYQERLVELGDNSLRIKVDSLEAVEQNTSLNWDKKFLLTRCHYEEFESFFLKWCDPSQSEGWRFVLENRKDTDLDLIIRVLTRAKWLISDFDWLSVFRRTSINEIEPIQLNTLFPLFISGAGEPVSYVSKKIDLAIIFQYSELNWDWSILTARMINEDVDPEYFRRFKSKIDWEYVIRDQYSIDEIIKQEVFDNLKQLLNASSVDMREKAYAYITQVYLDNAIIEEHISANKDCFDWDLISASQAFVMRLMTKALRGDYSIFDSISGLINKTIFSSNKAFISSLKKLDVESLSGWKQRVVDLLVNLEHLLDWKELSTQSAFSSSKFLIKRFDHLIDWASISHSSNLVITGNKNPNYDFIDENENKIDFFALSSRLDLIFDNQFVQSYHHKGLNFSNLSVCRNSTISEDLFFEKEKNKIKYLDKISNYSWNYKDLSAKTGFWKSGKLINVLPDKPWNWELILANDNIKIGKDIIKYLQSQYIDKELDWFEITSRKNFKVSFETLKSLTPNKYPELNWKFLSNHTEKWRYQEIKELKKYWIWDSLSWLNKGVKSIAEIESFIAEIDIKTLSEIIDIEELFREESSYLRNIVDWSVIATRVNYLKIILHADYLYKHRDYIDWTHLSSSTTFPFTNDLLEKYVKYWDWGELSRNPVIKENFQTIVNSKLASNKKRIFIDKLSQNYSSWTGKIYHFTHVENALKIIEKQCIYSRNSVIDFNDSAGSVVKRRSKAHNYARFYFRPLTLTQFYNEQLGKDYSDKYYEQALRLELPKCPIPIFFEFDLSEILRSENYDCYVSNGNMQANHARVKKIENSLNTFNFENVYEEETWEYKSATQQEFLVKERFDFTNLMNYKILVPDTFAKNYLETFITSEKIRKRIQVVSHADSVFHLNNCSIHFDAFNNREAKISTDYGNKHHFEIVFEDVPKFDILEGEHIVTSERRLKFSKKLNMKLLNSCEYRIDFYNELKKEPWTIVKTKRWV